MIRVHFQVSRFEHRQVLVVSCTIKIDDDRSHLSIFCAGLTEPPIKAIEITLAKQEMKLRFVARDIVFLKEGSRNILNYSAT